MRLALHLQARLDDLERVQRAVHGKRKQRRVREEARVVELVPLERSVTNVEHQCGWPELLSISSAERISAGTQR
jgi:hypothetical protein